MPDIYPDKSYLVDGVHHVVSQTDPSPDGYVRVVIADTPTQDYFAWVHKDRLEHFSNNLAKWKQRIEDQV